MISPQDSCPAASLGLGICPSGPCPGFGGGGSELKHCHHHPPPFLPWQWLLLSGHFGPEERRGGGGKAVSVTAVWCHITEDAGDVSGPEVLKCEDARGHLEGQVLPPELRICRGEDRTRDVKSSQVLLVLPVWNHPLRTIAIAPATENTLPPSCVCTTPQSSEAPRAVQLARNVPSGWGQEARCPGPLPGREQIRFPAPFSHRLLCALGESGSILCTPLSSLACALPCVYSVPQPLCAPFLSCLCP